MLNDSQTIRSTMIFQTPPLRDANLQWLVGLIRLNVCVCVCVCVCVLLWILQSM